MGKLDWKCDFCGKEVSALTNSQHGRYCNLCGYLLFGKKMNKEADFDYKTHDGIVLWIKDEVVETCWTNSGQTSVPIRHIKQYVPLLSPIGVIRFLRSLMVKKEVFCSDCGKIISERDVAGSHFAGRYCKECWEDYKEKNSRRCLMCGRPMYECCC